MYNKLQAKTAARAWVSSLLHWGFAAPEAFPIKPQRPRFPWQEAGGVLCMTAPCNAAHSFYMTRQNCRNSICRKKIWRRSLRRWGETHWKFTNNVSSLLRTPCNFSTRPGCDQEPPQGFAWALEKAQITQSNRPGFRNRRSGRFLYRGLYLFYIFTQKYLKRGGDGDWLKI